MQKHAEVVHKKVKGGEGGNMVYFFGLIGALVYYLQQASTIWEGIIGIIKAILWPAFVIYEFLKFLQM